MGQSAARILLRMSLPRVSQNAIDAKLVPNGRLFEGYGALLKFGRLATQSRWQESTLMLRYGVQSILVIRPLCHGKGRVLTVGPTYILPVILFFLIVREIALVGVRQRMVGRRIRHERG
jgi:hypothetical protein